MTSHPRIPLQDIVAELDSVLRIADFPQDYSHNGLQIEGATDGVAKICFGVDASVDFYAKALRQGADLLIVHHGISWGDSLARITGANHRLVAPLIRAGVALYAAHLPLDAHPTLGNNAGLARALGLTDLLPFGTYHGYTIGLKGRLPAPLPWNAFLERLHAACPDGTLRSFDTGSAAPVSTVGVVSGGAADMFRQAAAEGLDAYVTGEMGLQDYNALLAEPIRFAAAGHYATERFGVQSLRRHLSERFGVECEFIDTHLPY